jgi:pimeloyl-ACP methyl ester carboxylesterase
MSVVYAATYPAQVSALILAATSARMSPSADYPCGQETEVFWEGLSRIAEAGWGQGRTLEYLAPTLAKSERARKSVARWERMSVSPSAVLSLVAWARAPLTFAVHCLRFGSPA